MGKRDASRDSWSTRQINSYNKTVLDESLRLVRVGPRVTTYRAVRQRLHRLNPKIRGTAVAATRKYQLELRIPPWVTDFELGLMERYYQLASALGLTVDHVVPINGPTVCGFHCLSNLDMLTRSENSSKGNQVFF